MVFPLCSGARGGCAAEHGTLRGTGAYIDTSRFHLETNNLSLRVYLGFNSLRALAHQPVQGWPVERPSAGHCAAQASSQFENNYFTETCSGSEAGSYSRLIDCVYHSNLGVGVIERERGTARYRRASLPLPREEGAT